MAKKNDSSLWKRILSRLSNIKQPRLEGKPTPRLEGPAFTSDMFFTDSYKKKDDPFAFLKGKKVEEVPHEEEDEIEKEYKVVDDEDTGPRFIEGEVPEVEENVSDYFYEEPEKEESDSGDVINKKTININKRDSDRYPTWVRVAEDVVEGAKDIADTGIELADSPKAGSLAEEMKTAVPHFREVRL